MADITMCFGDGCNKKEKCWRFLAPETPHWQSYFVESPNDGENCKQFWPLNVENNTSKVN